MSDDKGNDDKNEYAKDYEDGDQHYHHHSNSIMTFANDDDNNKIEMLMAMRRLNQKYTDM